VKGSELQATVNRQPSTVNRQPSTKQMAQTPEAVLKEIRAKHFKPVYFLYGDEPYYIDLIAEELEKRVVPEAGKGFNQFVIYGKDSDLAGALGYAKR